MKKQLTVKKINKQAGWTVWSLLFILVVLGFSALVAMKLVPIYNANSNLVNAMKISVRDSDIRTVSRSRIIKMMRRQMSLDGSNRNFDFANNFKVVRNRNNLILSLDYESKASLISNVGIYVSFKPVLTCSLNGGCKESTAE